MNEVIRSVGKIRTNYVRGAIKEREMRGRGPRPVFYYQEAFDRWLAAHDAEVKREAAVKALTEAADAWQYGQWADAPRRADRIEERIANGQHATDWLRARAEACRRKETE